MLGLLPTEYWEYGVSDVVEGLVAALGGKELGETIFINGVGECIPTTSGRAGIVAAIKGLGLPPGAQIGVPLYCCPVVFKAIKEIGFTARFIDVEPETYCMSADDLYAKRSEVDAVIAVHMFGNLCDMKGLNEVLQGKPVIEDCAQSIGSKLDGRTAGTFGSIGVFSFRSGKYLSVGEGGALCSSNEDVRSRLRDAVSAMPGRSRKEECAHVAETYLRSKLRSKPLYGLVGYSLWSIYNRRVDYSAKSPIVMRQIFRSDLTLATRRLALLDHVIEAQRSNADFYSRTLGLDSGMLCAEKPGAFYNRYLYPIIFPLPEQRDMMAEYLYIQRIAAIQPYKDIANVAATHYGYAGDCPAAESIANRVLAIPSNYGLNTKDLERVAEGVKKGWAKIGALGRGKTAKTSGRT